MTDRFDLVSARESNGKTYFTKCGAMFLSKGGDKWNLVLDVMPASVEGQFRLTAMPPKLSDDAAPPARQPQRAASRPAAPVDLDDDIPF